MPLPPPRKPLACILPRHGSSARHSSFRAPRPGTSCVACGQEKVEDCINIAVVGNSGVGKSLLINRHASCSAAATVRAQSSRRLRKLRPQAEGWAAVGVNETTRVPTMHQSQNIPPSLFCVHYWSCVLEGIRIRISTYLRNRELHAALEQLWPSPLVRLWDLPGAGTAAVPAETYLQDFHALALYASMPSAVIGHGMNTSCRTWGCGTSTRWWW